MIEVLERNRVPARRAVGPPASTARNKRRNEVERAINRVEGFRAVAMRYDKRAYVSTAMFTAPGGLATAHTPGRPQARRPQGRRLKTSHPPSSDPVPADIDGPDRPRPTALRLRERGACHTPVTGGGQAHEMPRPRS